MVLLIKQLPIFIRKHKTKGQKLIQSFIKGSLQRNSKFYKQRTPLCKMTLRFVMIVLPNGQKECLITNLPANKFPPETLKTLLYTLKIETSFA